MPPWIAKPEEVGSELSEAKQLSSPARGLATFLLALCSLLYALS
jgi:hypothetical protein